MKKLLLKIAAGFVAVGSAILGFFLFFRGRDNQEIDDHIKDIKEQEKQNEEIIDEGDKFLHDNPPLERK